MVRNKILIKILAIIALCAFIGVSVLTVIPINSNAASVTDAQRKQKEAKQKENDAKTWQNNEMQKRADLDKQITAAQVQIDGYEDKINEKTKEIEESQAKIEALTRDLQDQNSAYNERAKVLIEKGNVSYFEIIMKSKSIEDFLTRMSVVKEITKYDSKKLQEIKDSMAQVEELKQQLLVQKNEVITLKQQIDSKKEELDGYRAESQQIIDQLSQDITAYEKEYQEAVKAEEQARAEAEALRKQANAQAGAYSKGSSGPSASAPAYTGGQFLWPSNTTLVTSGYGGRKSPGGIGSRNHKGVDIGAPYGSNVYAAADGKVLVAGYNTGGYGNYVVIDHGGGYSTLYGHNSSLCVSAGQIVSRGQIIAKCGSTGNSTGPHVHFEIHVNGTAVNPLQYFR